MALNAAIQQSTHLALHTDVPQFRIRDTWNNKTKKTVSALCLTALLCSILDGQVWVAEPLMIQEGLGTDTSAEMYAKKQRTFLTKAVYFHTTYSKCKPNQNSRNHWKNVLNSIKSEHLELKIKLIVTNALTNLVKREKTKIQISL